MDRTSCLKNWEKGELQDGEGGRTLFKNANDVTIFGVERQSVDIIRRGSASDSDNVVSCQVYGLLLDFVQQDGVHPTVQQGGLRWR